jgi:hypothetical protein
MSADVCFVDRGFEGSRNQQCSGQLVSLGIFEIQLDRQWFGRGQDSASDSRLQTSAINSLRANGLANVAAAPM